MDAKKTLATVALAVFWPATREALPAEPTLSEYLGRWNLRILDQKDTFESAGLEIFSKDGTLGGKLVWKWGGRDPIRDVSVESGELRFARGDEAYRARLEGTVLRGVQRTREGVETRFEGRRALELCDPWGTWRVYSPEDPERREAKLVLTEKDGKISGEAEYPDGRKFEVRDAKLTGYVIELAAAPADDPSRLVRARLEIRGDQLAGKVDLSRPGESEKREVEVRGQRDRRWGEPIALLAAEGTEGWRPRNPAAKFGWKVSGGILRNSPPDIDIVSERKFRDFKLHLEYRVPQGSNSGIYLRGRYELQILGDRRVLPHGNMAVYSVLSPTKNPMKPFDEWQSVDATLIGRWLTVSLNGEVVHEDAYLEGITGGAIDPWEDEPGPIMLQGDHGPVEFRNIVVTPAVAPGGDPASGAPAAKLNAGASGNPYGRWKNGPPSDPSFFPIAVWLQDPRNAKRYAEAGFNLYVGLWKGPTRSQLQALEAAGMRVICDQNEVGLEYEGRAIVGWMHGDEPDNAQPLKEGKGYGPPIEPARIVERYESMRARDPTRPVLLNLGQGVAWDDWHGRGVRTRHPEDYPEYVKGCDIASFDIYPVVHTHPAVRGKLWYVPRGVDRLREWTRDEKIVWNCIECTRISNPDAKPTPAQVRSEVWMAIAHGSMGLIYFVHQFKPRFVEAALFEDREMLEAVTAINRRIRELAPVLNSPPVEGEVAVKPSPPEARVDALVKRHGGSLWIIAVSTREEPARAEFRLQGRAARAPQPGAAPRSAEVLDESRAIEIRDGAFEDSFGPYEAHLYRIPE